jgi:tetratricopeptide (TPR) repeat protein
MALIYMEWEQFDWAFHSIGEKLSISRSLGDRMGVANSIGLMGKAYMRGGYYKEAAACLLFCLQEALQIGDVRVIALVLGLIGYTLDEQGIDEAGWRALEQSERIAATLGIPPIYCDTLYFMGHYAVKRERWDDAQRFIQQAVPLAEKHRRQGLICMLELLALRVHAGKNEAPPLDISDRLQLLLNRHPGRKEQAMIHVAQWELTGSEESRIQAVIQMEDLYRNAPVPYYMKWETILRIKLKGTLMNPPPIPREASQLEANLEEILEVVGDL